MFAPSHFHTHYFDDDGCSTDEFIDAEVKVDLQHVEFKGLRLSSLPPPLHRHLGSDPMSIVDPMLEEDGDQMLEDSVDLADYAYATGFEGGGLVGATNNIEVLPNEVFVLIFSYLDSRELLTVASTCHRWRHLAEGTLLSLLSLSEARLLIDSFPWAFVSNRGDSVEAGGGARLPLAQQGPRPPQALHSPPGRYVHTTPPLLHSHRSRVAGRFRSLIPLCRRFRSSSSVVTFSLSCRIGVRVASSKEADRERATGQSRWKSVWLAQKKTKYARATCTRRSTPSKGRVCGRRRQWWIG